MVRMVPMHVAVQPRPLLLVKWDIHHLLFVACASACMCSTKQMPSNVFLRAPL